MSRSSASPAFDRRAAWPSRVALVSCCVIAGLTRGKSVILLLPVEVGRLADPGLAADIGHRNPVRTLLQNKRLLGVRKRRGLHGLRSCQPGNLARKTLAKNGPVLRAQVKRRPRFSL